LDHKDTPAHRAADAGREIDRIMADPESRFVPAESNAAMLGCALVHRAGDSAYFGMFAVDPGRPAGGIGTALLAA
jgi:hypothetical protein